MAQGQRIDDHSFWGGSKGKDSVFPDGPHKTKSESSAEGAGKLMDYDDTTAKIKQAQVEQVKQAKSRPMKEPGYRN